MISLRMAMSVLVASSIFSSLFFGGNSTLVTFMGMFLGWHGIRHKGTQIGVQTQIANVSCQRH